jgi:hypothetical protein
MGNLAIDLQSMLSEQPEIVMALDAFAWAYFGKLRLQDGLYDVANHEYQIDMLQCNHPDQCAIKGGQIQVIKALHGMTHLRYPKGCLYLFPTWHDVTDFSTARFAPLISKNPQITQHLRRPPRAGGTGDRRRHDKEDRFIIA